MVHVDWANLIIEVRRRSVDVDRERTRSAVDGIESDFVNDLQKLIAQHGDGGWVPHFIHDSGAVEYGRAVVWYSGCPSAQCNFCHVSNNRTFARPDANANRDTARRYSCIPSHPPFFNRTSATKE